MNPGRVLFWLAIIVIIGLALVRLDASRVSIVENLSRQTVLAWLAIIAAVIALLLAWRAWGQRNQLRREVQALQSAVEQAMRERPSPTINAEHPTGADARAGMPRAVAVPRLLPWYVAGQAAPPSAEQRVAPSSNGAAGDMATLAILFAEGRQTISLRPVVSLSRGEAVAYDAFARFELSDGRHVDLRRLTSAMNGVDRARFERVMIVGAMRSARLLGDEATVHVAASTALLSNTDERTRVIETASAHPRAARAIVLDLPPDDAGRPGRHAEAIDALESAGLAIGIDLGASEDRTGDDWPRVGVRSARIPTATLLGWSRRRGDDGGAFVSTCKRADIAMIADDADSEETLIAIAEMGINLVTGDRFGAPRPMRATSSAEPASYG